MKISIELVKAFTKDKAYGNPAGVVLEASQLDDEQMLKVAGILGYSESAFVQKTNAADFKVRFFAVKEEVEFCGHATIATFHTLVEKDKIEFEHKAVATVTQETKAGIFPVNCYKDGKIMMAQSNPQFMETEKDIKLIASLLGLPQTEISELPVQTVSTVYPMLMIPLKSQAALKQIKPDYKDISQYSKEHREVGFYAFASKEDYKQIDLAARFFNPLLGINEDPATGVAAGPLGCYVDRYIFNGSKKLVTIEQGVEMGKSSTIYVDISGDVLVGGYATSFGSRELDI